VGLFPILIKSITKKHRIMKTIPTYVHGILDYIVGIVLLIAPNLFGFANIGGAPVVIPRVLGILILLQSLFTNYELGLFKVLPMRLHLSMDYVLSIFLALSPWLFGFHTQPGNVWMPHLIVGVLVFFETLMTQTEPRRIPARMDRRTTV
jgi:hypothetical protein